MLAKLSLQSPHSDQQNEIMPTEVEPSIDFRLDQVLSCR